ncbi:MAG: DUF4175 family protein, partial [Pseudomonadota bacterium]
SFTVTLQRSQTLTLRRNGSALMTWRFDIKPDTVPTIALGGAVRTSPRGAMLFDFEGTDDYGIMSARGEINLQPGTQASAEANRGYATLAPDADELIRSGPPRFALQLAEPGALTVTGKAFQDLTAHPYAGLPITVQLFASDEIGQEGASAVQQVVAPERPFRKPLAKAIIEQRRLLIAKPSETDRIALALDALMIAAPRFIGDATVLLSLQSMRSRLGLPGLPAAARSWSQDLAAPLKERRVAYFTRVRTVIDQLWDTALLIEDGDLSDAQRALRQAQQRLMDALQSGADQEEIARLMAELREAMGRFLAELAQQQPQGQANQGQQPPSQQLSSRDLGEMLNELERLAQAGRNADAQQLLSQLQDMMERLQSGRMAQNGQGNQGNQGMQQLERFGELIQGQQNLLDDTFRSGQQGQQGQQGQGREQGQGRQGQQGQGRGQAGQNGQGRQGQGRQGQNGQQPGNQNGQGSQPGQGQAGRGQAGRGQTGRGQGQGLTPGQLAQRQQQLREQLRRLQDGMGALRQGQAAGQQPGGNQPGGENGQPGNQAGGEDPLETARRAMERAREALQRGATGSATDEQSLALDQLRQGARDFARQLFDQNQSGQGNGSASNGRDPLGRQRANSGESSGSANGNQLNSSRTGTVPSEIDVQRARAILRELRQRLSDPARARGELEYLERLLERF